MTEKEIQFYKHQLSAAIKAAVSNVRVGEVSIVIKQFHIDQSESIVHIHGRKHYLPECVATNRFTRRTLDLKVLT